MKCWICDTEDIVYVDVIECPWCESCYDEIYLERQP